MADSKIHFLILNQRDIDLALELGVAVLIKGKPYWQGFYLIPSTKIEDK